MILLEALDVAYRSYIILYRSPTSTDTRIYVSGYVIVLSGVFNARFRSRLSQAFYYNIHKFQIIKIRLYLKILSVKINIKFN